MKKLLVVLAMVLLAAPAFAEPWVVCSPQSDADGYTYILDNGTPVDTPYTTFVASDGKTYAKIADVGSVANGNHTINVVAFKTSTEWGRLVSASVPFVFTRPSVGTPSGVGLKR